MTRSTVKTVLMGTALAGLFPATAHAQTSREAELERRVKALESAVQMLREELTAARATAPAMAASAPIVQPIVRPIEQAHALPASPAVADATPAAATADGFKVAGTTLKLNGSLKTWASISRYSGGNIAADSIGRDFYSPGLIPVGGRTQGNNVEANAKQTRIVLATETPVAGHTLEGLVEVDFQVVPGTQGNQRIVNGYNPGLRRAFFTFDRWLVGQEWTTFQYVGALPETTDFVGPTESTIFVRQAQVRYTHKLSDQLTLAVAAENPETTAVGVASTAPLESANDRLPDIAARLNYDTPFGEFSLAGLGRKLTIENARQKGSTTGWGVSFAGKIPFDAAERSDLRFMVTHGEGIGRYVGFALSPDAVLQPLPGGRLQTPSLTAGFAALKLGWTETLRSTFMAGAQHITYPTGAEPVGASASAWSAAANLFYSPITNVDLGIELRHAERTLVNGQNGKLDRGELAARYAF